MFLCYAVFQKTGMLVLTFHHSSHPLKFVDGGVEGTSVLQCSYAYHAPFLARGSESPLHPESGIAGVPCPIVSD